MKKSTLLTSLLLAGSFVASPAVFADPGHGKGQDKQARNWTQQQQHYKFHFLEYHCHLQIF